VKRLLSRFIEVMMLWSFSSLILQGQNVELQSILCDAELAVKDPITVFRSNGSHFEGQFAGLIDNGFVMTRKVGEDGSVDVDFKWDDVVSVQFPGDTILGAVSDLFAAGDVEGVIPVLSRFFEQRAPFFRVLPNEALKPFTLLAEGYLETQKPAEALAVVRGLKPYWKVEASVAELDYTELLAYLALDLNKDAVSLAKRLIEEANDPSGASLAWIALSLFHLSLQHYREAWLCAVHPILFDRRMDSPDLADAYLVATISNLRMNRPEIALRYHRDLVNRRLQLKPKSYQKPWLDLYESIDWTALESDHEMIEQFADIESKVYPVTSIDEDQVPVLRIPLVQH